VAVKQGACQRQHGQLLHAWQRAALPRAAALPQCNAAAAACSGPSPAPALPPHQIMSWFSEPSVPLSCVGATSLM
jgi:hypothetical protein